MALPVTLTSAVLGTQNSYHGTFKSSTGKFYVLSIGTTDTMHISMFMATDPTDSFAVQDASNEPNFGSAAVVTLWPYQKGDILYIAVQDINEDVGHAQFDMANDAWVSISGGTAFEVVDLAPEAQANAVSIAIEEGSSNEIVITYQGNPGDNKDMGGSFEWVAYAISDDAGVGASWSTENAVADVANASEVDFTGPVIVRGTNDRMHIFFKDDTNDDAYQRTLADPGGTPSLETFPSAFDSDVASSAYIFKNGVLLFDKVYCLYMDLISTVNRVSLVSFLSADVPIISVTAGISDSAQAAVNIESPALALDGQDLHLLYSEVLTDDIWHDKDTGSGWGTDVEILVASVSHISSAIYDRDGPKIAYVYRDASTVKYNELAITHTFGLLSDVNMGKQNSFHGPFET